MTKKVPGLLNSLRSLLFKILALDLTIQVKKMPQSQKRRKFELDVILAAIQEYADDLGLGIPPNQDMAHERFTKDERGHLRIRLIVEQMVQQMVIGSLLAAWRITVHLKR